MSQPPQPPQQPPNEPPNTPPGEPNTPPAPPAGPPSGGFGAPQDPPPGGFGQPTPPPADPFGKQPQQPQQPPQPPPAPQDAPAGGYGTPPPPAPGSYPTPPAPQPNGYGYPQAPQPGYGYPQGPAGQPGMPQQGYGYPTQPMQPQYAAPQQPGGGKKFSTQMQIIVAAAVAVVLIIGAGVIYASTGDDDKGGKNEASSSGSTGGEAKGGEGGLAGGDEKPPANTKSKVVFQLPEPEVDDVTTVMGSWITDKAYVKSGVAEIVAYDRDKGTKLWSVPLPGEVCSASRHMSKDYKTAVVFEETKATKENKYPSCNQVGVIDMAAGKLVWSKGVTSATGGDQQVRFDEVTLSGSTVAAGGTSGGAAFKLETGAELWKPKVGADGCYDRGYGGGDALAVVRKCGTSDSPQLTVQALNPTTGAPLSSFQMPAGVDYASIVSTKPLVVAADVGDTAGDGSGISDFFSIDAATGKLIVRIPADAEQYAARCGSTEVERCQNLAVGNNRLYLPTENHDGTSEYGDTNEIVAFDLTTGKLLGARADAGDRYSLVPLRMDGTSIIAYKEPPYDKGGQIVSIDGETFKQTLLMENPNDEAVREAERRFSGDHSELLYSEGHFFKSKRLISKRSVVDGDDKLYLVVGYRTD
ncbi:PQQ-binding-like beta-propeller repeat protein [Streptomyces sp. SID14515]|uniref:outer membrane protein assembly factor BamB family protein n=1 Tax=Streptomyces sp. SID14515 TaxID=2706074 RepID=UPI0013C8E1F6|nr:PQQ-binding-like beta-propeller repeat protein [Streptomyces sp. SID14515]NEB40949.1 PQQ-binding-like beta-propeller repeat protein [Streptomyces sp. SID14515]NEB42069.1 PQQ-binding-like beta-propeller repeat protein [Streptomyces sp. SID14515]